MSEPIHIISLGAGVQSSCLSLMASEGEITPMPKLGIFADTMAEPQSVYTWLAWLEKQLPFPIQRVSHGNLEEDSLRVRARKDGMGHWVRSGIPHYSINADGTEGHGPRQCTGDFKLEPLLKAQLEAVFANIKPWKLAHKAALKALSEHAAKMRVWKRAKKAGEQVDAPPMRPVAAWAECQADPLVISWIGISLDESSRVKDALRPWINNRYPLIEARITRRQCLAWMKAKGYPEPPRSACVFCPYKSDEEWRRMQHDEPKEFQRAIDFEKKYQAAKALTVSKKHFKPFLHSSRVNLGDVDFSTEEDRGQTSLFNNECLGMCGV